MLKVSDFTLSRQRKIAQVHVVVVRDAHNIKERRKEQSAEIKQFAVIVTNRTKSFRPDLFARLFREAGVRRNLLPHRATNGVRRLRPFASTTTQRARRADTENQLTRARSLLSVRQVD